MEGVVGGETCKRGGRSREWEEKGIKIMRQEASPEQ